MAGDQGERIVGRAVLIVDRAPSAAHHAAEGAVTGLVRRQEDHPPPLGTIPAAGVEGGTELHPGNGTDSAQTAVVMEAHLPVEVFQVGEGERPVPER